MTRKIKVAYLIDSLKRAGAQKLLLDICKNIDLNKFEATVIALKSGDFYEEFRKLDKLTLIVLKNQTKSIKSSPAHKFPVFLKQQEELREIVGKEDYDIIHSHLFFPDIHNSLLKRKFNNVVAISTKHDTGFYRKLRYYFVGKLFDSNMDSITTCSRSVTNILSKYLFIKKIKTIHNAIDTKEIFSTTEQKSELIDRSNFNIISVGRLTEQKGFDHLIRVFKLVNNNKVNTNLFICGEGEKREELEKLIFKLGLNDRVHLLGERRDIYSLMKQCDLFILLSNWEGFGIVFLEALACKLPVIGSNVDGIREIIEDQKNGYLVERFEHKKIAELISNLQRNKQLMDTIAENGLITLNEKFEISKIVKEYEKIYVELTTRKEHGQ